MMKIIAFLFIFLSVFSHTALANSMAEQCVALKSNSPEKTAIYKAEWVEKSAELPAYCLVQGEIGKRVEVDNVPYGIQFELRLPEQWNEKFLFQGRAV